MTEPAPFDHPVEVDCDCGAHHVLDPEEINRFLQRRKFRCVDCRRRKYIDDLGALVASHPVTGICKPCDEKTTRGDLLQ